MVLHGMVGDRATLAFPWAAARQKHSPMGLPRPLIRVALLPALKIIFFDVRSLFLLGKAIPGLIGLRKRPLVGPLARIVFRRFFAHAGFLSRAKGMPDAKVPRGSGRLSRLWRMGRRGRPMHGLSRHHFERITAGQSSKFCQRIDPCYCGAWPEA